MRFFYLVWPSNCCFPLLDDSLQFLPLMNDKLLGLYSLKTVLCSTEMKPASYNVKQMSTSHTTFFSSQVWPLLAEYSKSNTLTVTGRMSPTCHSWYRSLWGRPPRLVPDCTGFTLPHPVLSLSEIIQKSREYTCHILPTSVPIKYTCQKWKETAKIHAWDMYR